MLWFRKFDFTRLVVRWLGFICFGCFLCQAFVVWFYFFRNRSASPSGGNQVDGLPPAFRLWWSSLNFSKSVNSFCSTVFFPCFFGMWLSIGGFIWLNNCATPEISITSFCHCVHVARRVVTPKSNWPAGAIVRRSPAMESMALRIWNWIFVVETIVF